MVKRNLRIIDPDDESPTPIRSGKLSNRVSNGRRHHSDEEDEQAELSAEDDADDEPSDGHRKKKRRGDSEQVTTNGAGNKGKSRASTQRAATVDLSDDAALETVQEESYGERHPDGFLPGSVVRLSATNFMTYSEVEFHFGSHLNMIIGPNGTGKSAFMCALALGLGYSPVAVLQRVNEVKLFVKNGTNEGSIEIELKGKLGEGNVVIKLHLNVETSSRIFEINGKRATHTKVQEIIRSFNIQVDNLCCFLPQERLREFSAMDPIGLLRATQKCAGHSSLIQWHDILIEKGRKKIGEEAQLEKLQEEKQHHDKRLQNMKRDVDILLERQAHEARIKVFEFAIRQRKYGTMRDSFLQAKQECSELEKDIARLKEANLPMTRQIQAFKGLTQAYDQCRKTLESNISSLTTTINQRHRACNSARDQRDKISEEFDGLKDIERRRRERVGKLKAELEELTEQTAIPDPASRPYTTKGRYARALQEKVNTNQDALRGAYSEVDRIIHEQGRVRNELDRLNNVTFRKEAALRDNRHTVNVYNALQTMRQLRDAGRFQGQVFEPIRMVISPKNMNAVQAIEGCLGFGVFNTFLCTHDADYDLLSAECNDVHKYRDSLSQYQPAVPREELQSFGFEGYVIDLIDGPDPTLAYLCSQAALHQIPITLSPRASLNDSRLEARDCPFRSWIVGDTRFNVSFSSYGNREQSIGSSSFQKPSVLTMGTLDHAAIAKGEAELETLREREDKMKGIIEEYTTTDKRLRASHNRIQKSRQAAQEKHIEYAKLVKRKEMKAKSLAHEESQPSSDQRRAKLQQDLKKACLAHMKSASEYKTASCQKSRLTTELISYQLRLHQNKSDAECFAKVCARSDDELKEREADWDPWQEATNFHTQLRQDVDKSLEEYPDLREELMLAMKETTPDGELLTEDMFRASLEAEQDALNLTHPVDPEVAREYEKLKKEVGGLQNKIDGHERVIHRLKKKIAKVYDLWKPHLDELVAKVDSNYDAMFEAMGGMGTVLIEENPDFGKWGITIKVSFRKDEPLMPLNEYAQSGGERSKSTGLFLMALTRIAKTPFCAVDEINQGLDPDNERMLHNQVVASTCLDSTSQYFLITPKILLDLDYHPKMRVLCINNGHWLPAGFKIRGFLQNAKKNRHQRIRQ
ncbi:hypothetical protein DFH28DRAFT_942164 [Melampsora americana]|nr:hypothetical protein DFH28DRAFT_942164 [Melampsora americana]